MGLPPVSETETEMLLFAMDEAYDSLVEEVRDMQLDSPTMIDHLTIIRWNLYINKREIIEKSNI